MSRTLLAAIAGAFFVWAGAAQAAPVAGTFDDSSSATFSPSPLTVFVSASAVGNGDVLANTGSNAQSPANITLLLQNVFDVPMDLVGSTSEGGVTASIGSTSGSVSSAVPFRFASLHGGQYQWLIDFGVNITGFTFQGLERGLSGVVVATPVPAAALLFAPALGALVWMRRRKTAA